MIGSRQGFSGALPVCPSCVRALPPGAVACPWCGHPPPPAAAEGGAFRRGATGAGLLAGGVLVALSPVLPWLRGTSAGTVRLVGPPLPGAALPVVLAPVAVLVIGVVAMVSGPLLPRGTAARVTAGLLGGSTLLVGTLALVAMSEAVPTGWVGAGPWLALAGAAVLTGAAVLPVPGAGPPAGSALRRQSVPLVGTAVVAVFAVLGLVALFGAAARARVEPPSPAAASGPPAGREPVVPVPSTASPVPPPTSTVTVPPPPTVTTTAPAEPVSASDTAEELVRGKGYRPAPNTSWQPVHGLHVIVGVRADTADGQDQRAFFFHDARGYLGTDTSGASAGITEMWSTDDTVALSYVLFHVGDPRCCPTAGAATVRYLWDGTRLVPLDPIPSDDPRAVVSRR
ncbi:LppP/LprE family lipoprotein [Amycolatopsis samaneae]|uniref:LppP/LprE family lipoprotein n=1 Tax=Amycolatopsis samaneae TaxID=664691 RepID=A0ABW5GFR5_9PSEU